MRLTGRVTNLEHSAAATQESHRHGVVVIYDRHTGLPLPGWEPDPRATVAIWIPAKDPLPDPESPPEYAEDER